MKKYLNLSSSFKKYSLREHIILRPDIYLNVYKKEYKQFFIETLKSMSDEEVESLFYKLTEPQYLDPGKHLFDYLYNLYQIENRDKNLNNLIDGETE